MENCKISEYNAFGFFSYHGAKCVHSYNTPKFVALDYEKARLAFLNRLKQNTSLDFHTGKIIDIIDKQEYIEIHTKSDNIIKTRLLIDASGISHLTYRFFNMPEPKMYSHSFGQGFENVSNEKPDEAYFIAPSVDYGSGGGWYYPYGKAKASVGSVSYTHLTLPTNREV